MGDREDGTKFVVAQIGNKLIDNKTYYRYYYMDVDKNGKLINPVILYGETNITSFMNFKRFNFVI
jgi:hypothetical protein